MDTNSQDSGNLPVPHQTSFIVHIQIPTTLTVLTPSTLLPPHNLDPTYLSIHYIFCTHLPILISNSTEPQSSSFSPCTSSYSSSSLALHEDFSSKGAAVRVTLLWCALIGVEGSAMSTCGVFLMPLILLSDATLFLFLLFFFLPDSTFSFFPPQKN